MARFTQGASPPTISIIGELTAEDAQGFAVRARRMFATYPSITWLYANLSPVTQMTADAPEALLAVCKQIKTDLDTTVVLFLPSEEMKAYFEAHFGAEFLTMPQE